MLSACGPVIFPELNESIEISDFGFSIDYPEGWFAEIEGPITWIAELESDFEARDEEGNSKGIAISLEHRPIDFLMELGLRGDPPSLNDLFTLNVGELSGMTNPNITEVIIFGVPALRSEYYEDQWDISYAGFLGDEAFYFRLTAPTENMLNDFRPTWEKMLERITPLSN